MTEQYALTEDEYKRLKKYVSTGLPKDWTSDYKTFTSVHDTNVTITKVKVFMDGDDNEYTKMILWYNGIPCLIKDKREEKDVFVITCESAFDRCGFEFIPVKDKRQYDLSKAYDMIKLGLTNLYGSTNDKETVDSIFQLVKGLEEDDTKDAS